MKGCEQTVENPKDTKNGAEDNAKLSLIKGINSIRILDLLNGTLPLQVQKGQLIRWIFEAQYVSLTDAGAFRL